MKVIKVIKMRMVKRIILSSALCLYGNGCYSGNDDERERERGRQESYVERNIDELERFLEERKVSLEDVVEDVVEEEVKGEIHGLEVSKVDYEDSEISAERCGHCGFRGFFGEFKMRELRDWFKENLDYAVDCFGLGGDYCEHSK